MRKIILSISVVLLVVLFFSCASGSSVVTGNQRPAISPDEVVIYAEEPEKYEVIGIVTASSDATGISQKDLDYAIAELKKQAAKIGANGVVLQNVSSSNGSGLFIGGIFVNEKSQDVSGKAIYVER